MKRNAVALGLLLTGTAAALPLLGTSHSFFNSTFCRTYSCALTSKEPLTASIVDFRYTIKTGGSSATALPTLSVVRINNVVSSIGFVIGAQDYIFSPGNALTRMWLSAVNLATGTFVSEAAVMKLEKACETANGTERTIRVGRFTVGCVDTGGEFSGARRVALRVYR